MGTPVSKSTENSVSETETELTNRSSAKENDITNDLEDTAHKLANLKQVGNNVIAKQTKCNNTDEDDENVVQMLCAADDDAVCTAETNDVYRRLKTNKNENLHVSNTKFNANTVQSYQDVKLSSGSTGTVFTKTLAERNTRISSANFSPHSVSFERENCGANNKVDIERSTEKENNEKTYSCAENKDSTNQLSKPCKITTSSDDDFSEPSADGAIFCEPRKDSLEPFAIERIQYLSLPEPQCDQDLSDRVRASSLTGDVNADPLEGLDIPREKVHSIGSASVYSVREISDDLYQQYMAEIKSSIRSYGFFEAFPSPSLVREAQNIYRKLDMPTPVDDEGNVLPHPSKVTIEDILPTDAEVTERLRNKIAQITGELDSVEQLSDLVHHLCRDLEESVEKLVALLALVLYQQMTGRLLYREDICKRLGAMCRFARIKRRLIKGTIRDSRYVPGEDLLKYRGTWLAVLISSTWVLIDPVIDKVVKSNNNTAKMDEKEIFKTVRQMLQNPEQFIFSHFPDEEHWQLLARPVTQEELTKLAVVRPSFFDLGMNFVNQAKSVIITDSTEVTISLAFPEDVLPKFKCKICICDKSISDVRMRTYVFLETLLLEHLVKVRVRFPKRGRYIITMYVKTEGYEWEELIKTRLIFEGSEVGKPFPDNPREEWGPGFDTISLGLIPKSFHSGEIKMQKGIIQIVFSDTKGLQFGHVLFKEDILVDTSSLKVSFLKDKNNEVVFVVDIDIKIIGTFILQLLARSDKRADFSNFCTYLITKEKAMVIPKLHFNNNKQDDNTNVIRAPPTGKLQLTVNATGYIQLIVELKLHDRQELNFSEHASHWISGEKGFIDLNFPRKGKYTLHVQGRAVVKGRFQSIREETIFVSVPSERWSPFPKELGHWNSWYRIYTPLTHHLEEKNDVEFIVDIRNAQDVAVLTANGWYHLEKQEGTWRWQGQVWTGPRDTRCRLLSRFEVGSEKWSDLLWFKVMSEDAYERMEERQQLCIEHARKEPA